jgi:hypothetical protein
MSKITLAALFLVKLIFLTLGEPPQTMEAIDRGNTAARIFFADFSTGFDLIDHNMPSLQDLI